MTTLKIVLGVVGYAALVAAVIAVVGYGGRDE